MTRDPALMAALVLIGLCALICAIDNVRNHNRLVRLERAVLPPSQRRESSRLS